MYVKKNNNFVCVSYLLWVRRKDKWKVGEKNVSAT